MERKVYKYPSLKSTNTEALRLISELSGNQPFYVVSDYQDSGRGQGNNIWVSDPEKNILMTWVVFPAFLSVHLQFKLSKAVSLALTDLLLKYNLNGKIKWPNDIVSEDQKIAGILIENSILGNKLKHCLVGIGLNVNQTAFPEFPYRACSMHSLSSFTFDINEVLEALFATLEKRYMQLKVDEKRLDSDYLERMFRLNTKTGFSRKGEYFDGIIRGISELGELVVETEKEILSFGFHEVKIIY